ncbi:MAG TPA: extracellular solute-binding protein [Fimbriimonadaceae bacterium]|nr:extracellular solute-binding protein [Fimbriimonadaceae bacterium]
MKQLLPLGTLALALALVGCSGSGAKTSDAVTAPEAPVGDKPTGDVEVMAFKGGYDIDFYADAAKELSAKNPGLKITVEGDPNVADKIQPRLIAGSPPSLMFPGWKLDQWAAAEEGQLDLLDQALASPAYDGKGTWGDTFDPKILKLGQLDGKQFVLPFWFNVWGMWYDPGVFAKHGWKPPKTYDELLTLCGQIKAAGIAPITFQGRFPYYMVEGMLLPWAQDIGGMKAVNDAQNLEPGAWKSPAMLKAAGMIVELRDKGYFEEGAVGLTHTDAQTDFLNGKAAMIPCGTWLDTEMKKTMPKGASVEYLVTPAASGTGDPTAVPIDVEPWMVPSAGKNPNGAIALLKYMTSLDKAKQFVSTKYTLTAIKGSDQVKNLPPSLKAPLAAFNQSKTQWSYELRYWYKAFEDEIENGLTELINGGTAEKFCDRCEAAAEKIRKDDSIKKHKVGG